MNYPKDRAPKIAVVANSIGVFSRQGKETAETQMKSFFQALKKQGAISQKSLFWPERIFAPHEAEKVLDSFVGEKIDALVVLNSAFPNGNTFLTFAANAYLWRIPLIVTAPPEIDLKNSEWTTNAYCGLIMNNHVAKQIGRHIFTLAGWPEEENYQTQFHRLLRVVYTIKELRKDVLGKFGDAPSGFHSASGDQLAYAAVFGTRVETVDLAQVLEAYRTGKAEGPKGTAEFTDQQVEETLKKMTTGVKIATAKEGIKKSARLYHAFKALIEANGFTSVTIRCWPEILQILDVPACFSHSWLLSEGVVHSSACEGDWPNAVAQSIGALLSGKPSLCLDLVNDIGAKPIVQLGHCGVGIPCLMADAELSQISPERQVDIMRGPTCIGQLAYGVKTGLALMQDRRGKFNMLVFTGENSPDTQQNILFCAADIEVPSHKKLNDLIMEHGFPHHVALAFGDLSKELSLLCGFYGIEYINPS